MYAMDSSMRRKFLAEADFKTLNLYSVVGKENLVSEGIDPACNISILFVVATVSAVIVISYAFLK